MNRTLFFLIFGFLFLTSFGVYGDVSPNTTPSEVAPVPSAPAEQSTYSGEKLKLKLHLEKLFEASRNVNGKEKEKHRDVVSHSVDWQKVALDCLGQDVWSKNPKDRTTFQNLLKDIILLTAYGKMGEFWAETTYTFPKIDLTGNKAQVSVQFKAKSQGYLLDYYFIKQGSQWKMVDIAVEGLKYTESINEQIGLFLTESSIKDLLKRLQKKKEELHSEKKA